MNMANTERDLQYYLFEELVRNEAQKKPNTVFLQYIYTSLSLSVKTKKTGSTINRPRSRVAIHTYTVKNIHTFLYTCTYIHICVQLHICIYVHHMHAFLYTYA